MIEVRPLIHRVYFAVASSNPDGAGIITLPAIEASLPIALRAMATEIALSQEHYLLQKTFSLSCINGEAIGSVEMNTSTLPPHDSTNSVVEFNGEVLVYQRAKEHAKRSRVSGPPNYTIRGTGGQVPSFLVYGITGQGLTGTLSVTCGFFPQFFTGQEFIDINQNLASRLFDKLVEMWRAKINASPQNNVLPAGDSQ